MYDNLNISLLSTKILKKVHQTLIEVAFQSYKTMRQK